MTQLLDALVEICGPDYARVARSVDVVGGERAGHVAVPATTQAVADTVHLAADRGLTAVPRGSGSKIDWGRPRAGADLIIDTGRLGGLWHHDASAATADVGAGTPVRAVHAALALRGQRLPVDPPSRTATVGGMLAFNESGPLRHRFGTPAEHVARITYVGLDGQVVEADCSGGRSSQTPAALILISAAVRLQPLPAAQRWVTVRVATPSQAAKLAAETAETDEWLTAAIEADLPAGAPGELAAQLEGEEKDVLAGAERLAGAWGAGAAVAMAPPTWWGVYPFGRDDVSLRLSASTADLPAIVYALADAVGGLVPVRGSVGLGTVHAVLPGTLAPTRLEQIMDSLRHVLMARDGRVAVVSAPLSIAGHVDMASRREMF